MNYPLAHDENGSPLDVPANANGWLVRRHAGGRGRPAAVYDADGRPLVVPLDSTAQDLRSYGCKPGTYRLDAVDSGRRGLSVVAYTEVSRDGAEEDVEVGAAPAPDAAVAALARAVEAMQRVQAERERAQAERERAQADMIARLVERLAPPAPQAPRNAPELLREYGDVQRQIRKLSPEPEELGNADASALEIIADVMQRVTSQVLPMIMKQRAANAAAAPSAAAPVEVADESEGQQAAEPAASEAAPQADPAVVDQKLAEVFALLTPEEAAQVRTMSQQLPPEVVEGAMEKLLTMTAEEAAAEVRRLFGTGLVAGGKAVVAPTSKKDAA